MYFELVDAGEELVQSPVQQPVDNAPCQLIHLKCVCFGSNGDRLYKQVRQQQ